MDRRVSHSLLALLAAGGVACASESVEPIVEDVPATIPAGVCDASTEHTAALVREAIVATPPRPNEPRTRLLGAVHDPATDVLHGLGVGGHYPFALGDSPEALAYDNAQLPMIRLVDDGALLDADTLLTVGTDVGYRVLDVSDPTSPQQISQGMGNGVRAAAVDGDRVALVGVDPEILFYARDAVHGGPDRWLTVPGRPWDIALRGDVAWVADNDGALQVLDLAEGSPRLGFTAATAGRPEDLAVCGDTLFAAVGGPGVEVFSLADPTQPRSIGLLQTGAGAVSVDCADGLLWAANREGVLAWDVSTPASPIPLGHVTTDDHAMAVTALPNDRVAVSSFRNLEILRVDRTNASPSADADRSRLLFPGALATEGLVVHNRGAASLELQGWQVGGAEGYTLETDRAVVAPGEAAHLTLGWTGEGPAPDSFLCLATNDPDQPQLEIALGGSAGLEAPVGLDAPDFALPNLDGDVFSLAEQLGRPVLLSFFATWCPLCGTELGDLQSTIVPRYEAEGLVTFAIASEDTPDAVAWYLEDRAIDAFPVLLDQGGVVQRQFDELTGFQGTSYPWNWLIGVDGTVSYFNRIYDAEAIEAAIVAELDR